MFQNIRTVLQIRGFGMGKTCFRVDKCKKHARSLRSEATAMKRRSKFFRGACANCVHCVACTHRLDRACTHLVTQVATPHSRWRYRGANCLAWCVRDVPEQFLVQELNATLDLGTAS